MNNYTYVVNNLEPIEEKRIKLRRGAKLVMAKNPDGEFVPHKYVFNKDYFTEKEAEETLHKLGVEASKPEIGGRVWSAGMHHVFVDGEPARVYVPEETIESTFNAMNSYIKRNGSLKLGLDHLQDEFLKDNQILAKMNLLDVGDITKIHTDGQSIYIDDSVLTNTQIKELNARGELPMYSIVGAMETRPCPSGKADYVVDHLDVTRVDIVEEGGCAACKVNLGVSEDLKITAKLSKVEAKNMAEETQEIENTLDAIKELQKQIEELKLQVVKEEEEETPVEEVVESDDKEQEEKEDEEIPVEPEKEEEPVAEVPEPVVEQEVPEVEDVKDKEIADLKKKIEELEGKSSISEFDINKAVNDLVEDGRASPKMRDALHEIGAKLSKEDFETISAALPQVLPDMEVKAKFAKQESEVSEKKTEEEEKKRILKAMGL